MLDFKFVGSGAEYAAISTLDLPTGGRWTCGQSNQGAPDCRLQEAQQCCRWEIAGDGFDLGGQTITITASDRIGSRGLGVFIEWQGICAQPPVPCNEQFARWCKNGLDRRGGGRCTLILPVQGGDDVDIVTVWEGGTRDGIDPFPICGPNGGPTGTCGGAATTTSQPSPSTTTTTTLPPDQLPAWKREALELMRRVFEQSLYPCLVATSGVAVLATPPVAIGAVAGATMLGVAAPLCAEHVKTLLMLQTAYNDPPDPDYTRRARVARTGKPSLGLPSCAQATTKKDRAACGRLNRLATRYVLSVMRTTSVAVALATTANRYGAATAAADVKAATGQSRYAGTLVSRVGATSRARARAGARVAAVLRSIGVTGSLTEAQAREAGAGVLTALAARGVTEDTSRALLGDAGSPGAIDVLSRLGQP